MASMFLLGASLLPSFRGDLSAQDLAASERSLNLPAGFELRTFSDEQGDHEYLVFTPVNADDKPPAGIMLFLHGAGERGNTGLLPLATSISVMLENQPRFPFVVVIPQCEDLEGRIRTGWLADNSEADRALAILESTESDWRNRWHGDPPRRVLVGWSMGGYGAWSLAAADPERWSAVLAISGGETASQLDLTNLAE